MNISNKYLVEALVFFSYVLFAMAWVGGTASMGQIMTNLDISSLAAASFISGAVTVAKIVGTFCAAWFALKFGIKGAFFVSCLLVTVGLMTPYAPNYEWLLVSRFLMGLGGALMIVYFNPIVMSWFSVEERPTINGLNAVAFNIGTALVLWCIDDFNALTGSWKHTLIWFSSLSGILAVAWLLVKFEKPQTQNSESDTPAQNYHYKDGLTDRFNWVYAFTYSGLLAFYICLFTFYPTAGISASKWVIGAGIIGTIVGMLYSRTYKQRVPVIKWSGLVQTLMVIGLSFSPSETMQTVCAVLLGFFIFFPITALVSIPHEMKHMDSSKITIVFSLFWSISYLVATLVLWVFGLIVDINNGDFFYAFVMISIVSSSFFLGSFLLPEPNSGAARHVGETTASEIAK